MRTLTFALLGAMLLFSASGCGAPAGKQAAPLASVEPLPAVSPPPLIAAISPTGSVESGAQILIRFKNDLVPLEQLEAPDRVAALQHFRLDPAIPGRFTVWTPRMVGFSADAPLPKATRFRVTLESGLTDLKNNALADAYAWTFTTEAIKLDAGSSLSGDADTQAPPVALRPVLEVSSNVELVPESLLAHARIVDAATGSKTIDVQSAPEPSPSPSDNSAPGPNPGDQTFTYRFKPKQDLGFETKYRLEIAPGVQPRYGNLATTLAQRFYFQTHGALAFVGVGSYGDPAGGGGGRFDSGAPKLAFTNSLDPNLAPAAVTVSPAPLAGVPLVRVDDDGHSLDVNPNALAPDTHYTLDVAAGLKDVFGQSLGRGASGTFDTSDVTPDFWAPAGLSIFPAAPALQLNIETTNLPDGHYRAAYRKIAPRELVAVDPSNADGALGLLPPASQWEVQPVPATRNEAVDTAVPVRAKLGADTGMLAYGATARTFRRRDQNGSLVWVQPSYAGFAQLTDVGIFAQWFPSGGLVRTSHLSDGSPLAGAGVEIYESLINRIAKPQTDANQPPCATGRTDAQGMLVLDAAAFARCASTATSATSAPELLVIARTGSDWGYVRTREWSAYSRDFYAGWSAGVPNSHGTIVCDRSLYQPGERAEFNGVAYFETNGVLARGRAASYAVTIEGPNGEKTRLGAKTLDPFGAFAVSWNVGKHAAPGYYEIFAKADNGESLSGTFRVAEFKPPNFKVDLKLNSDIVAMGATVDASAQSMYLFGAPVEGGTTRFNVTRAQTDFQPKGWDAFTFGRAWFYPEEPPSVSSDVLQKDVTVDAAGNTSLQTVVADDLPYAMAYRVDAETTDASNLSVTDSKTFTALPSPKLIGLRGEFVGTAGKPYALAVIVTDPKGHALAGEHVHLVLQRREFPSATQLVAGSETEHEAVHYVDVAQVDVDSQTSPVNANLGPDKPGDYRVRANFSGANGEAGATDQELWVTGPGSAAWGLSDDNALALKLDKTSYRPGDVATALIESPYPEGELFFAVIRHGVIYRTTQIVHGSAPQVHFTVTPEMLPNAAIEAVLVRRGAPLAGGIPAGLGKLARLGFVNFEVNLDSKYVKVAVTPLHASVAPGATQRLRLHLSDRAGRPVRGELTLAVVNDAILQLTGYRFPDLVKIVYADQPISTRFADSRADVQLVSEKRTVDKGFGYGGGAMAGIAGTRVRSQFKPLAYWNASIRTDEAGNATVDFALPDDLTTWRVMALALTSDARFGNGETTFIATKPLVSNPILPQFVRPGDRFSAGLAVTDVAHAGGQYSIDAQLAGDAVFVDGDQRSSTKTLQAQAQGLNQAFRFDVLVTGPKDAQTTMTSKLGSNSDAFTVPLSVASESVTESTAQVGTTTTRASVPLNVAAALPTFVGGLDLTLASTLLADAVEPAHTLEAQRPPFATSLAARIAIASDALALGHLYGNDASAPRYRSSAQGDLAALHTLVLPDGGFAAWPGAKASELYSNAFVAMQLRQAKSAGIDVGADLTHLRAFLGRRLADPGDACLRADPDCIAEARLEALETLVALGDRRTDYLSDIVAHKAKFNYYEQVELARLLVALPDWHAQGLALRDKLMEQVYVTSRRATINVPGAFAESPVAGQSQVLGLLIDSGSPGDDVDRALSSLLSLRKNGTWGCTCDDAEAMTALLQYAKREPVPPNFEALAQVGSISVSAQFHGYTRTSVQKTIPMAQLPQGRNEVALSKTGAGTLHYVVAFRYGVLATAPGAYAGIRIDRFVRAANGSAVLASFGLAIPDVAPSLEPAKVYDIEDRITTDHPLMNVVIEDPLPGGLEAIDASFRTSNQYYEAGNANWEIDYQSIYHDRVLTFAHELPAGVYAVHYLVRSVTPGDFAWPGARVSLQYEPEQFGRTAATRLTIAPK